MIIKFNGATTFNQFEETIREIVRKVEGQINHKVENIRLKDMEVGVLLTVDGEERYLTVTHDELEEVFTVFVQLDEEGNVLAEKDNKEETLLDDFTRSVLKNEELPTYQKIESIYNDDELEFLEETGTTDLTEQKFRNKDGDIVIRYLQQGVGLISEITHKTK